MTPDCQYKRVTETDSSHIAETTAVENEPMDFAIRTQFMGALQI